MLKTALIVSDMQDCFINDKTKDLPLKIKKHIEKVNYDFIIFSKFVNTKDSNFVKKLNWSECMKKEEQNICSDFLELADSHYVFEKNTYSIFKAKGFQSFLIKNNINKLYFCGLDLDACILASTYEAFDLNYDFEILFELSDSSSKKNIVISSKGIIKRNLSKQ